MKNTTVSYIAYSFSVCEFFPTVSVTPPIRSSSTQNQSRRRGGLQLGLNWRKRRLRKLEVSNVEGKV